MFDFFQEMTQTVEQLLDGTDTAGGVVIQTAQGQYEVVATEHHDHSVTLLPESEISIMDLMDDYRSGK